MILPNMPILFQMIIIFSVKLNFQRYIGVIFVTISTMDMMRTVLIFIRNLFMIY